MSLILVGLNHKTSPVRVREKFTLLEAQIPKALAQLKKLPDIQEVLILSTCNRTELYTWVKTPRQAMSQISDFLLGFSNLKADKIKKYLYVLSDDLAIEHLFRVTSGLDSMVIGESQVLGQVKNSFLLAEKGNFICENLNFLFRKALELGKNVRTQTDISKGTISIPAAVVELIKHRFKDFQDKKILIIGAGQTGELTVKILKEEGFATIIIANRTLSRSQKLAQKFFGQAIKLSEIKEFIPQVDIVISSTTSPHFIFTKEKTANFMKLRKNLPIFLIDIAVPRDISPSCKRLKNVTLYNIDDLESIAKNNLEHRAEETEKVQKIIDKYVDECIFYLNARRVVPVIKKLQDQFKSYLDEELKKIPASKNDIEELNLLGNSLIQKLLHRPIVNIKELAQQRDFSDKIQTILDIFDLD